ncbi:hypothetical protein [Pelosinus sp. sgz500959]|uniref:hypothetical protein n=1 Tax=Pelosinus sp. sgz500959 TaxID=3242472 RepID=UPI003672BA3A
MGKSPKIFVNKLLLIGWNKNYEVPFHKGVNIIYGDSDTGKSSILNLIDYLLGASKVYLYDELEACGRYALLEILLNARVYTIQRDIFKSSDYIKVYPCSIENKDEFFPLEYGPNYKKIGPAGYFSDFLLDALNIPKISVKKAPTKDDSDLARVSFRDIFKYCYMSQDDVGDKKLLDRENYSLATKNQQTFRFIHNILDTQIADLEIEIQAKTRAKNDSLNRYNTVTSFLREVRFDTSDDLDGKLSDLKMIISRLEIEEKRINSIMRSDNSYLNELRKQIILIHEEIQKTGDEKVQLIFNIEQNICLKKEYQCDIEKIKAIVDVMQKLPQIPSAVAEESACPLCHSNIGLSSLDQYFVSSEKENLDLELKSFSVRLKSLESLISEQRNELIRIDRRVAEFQEEERKLREILDIKTSEYVSPYLQERDLIVSQKSTLTEELHTIEYFKRIRRQLDEINNEVQIREKAIVKLKEKIDELKVIMPTSTQIVNSLADILSNFLDVVKIRNRSGVSVSEKTFLPILRNRNYHELTSGGVRTIVSIGYYLSLLKNSLKDNTYLPSLVMIDSISKYLGKTDSKYLSKTDTKEDAFEGVQDPQKRLNILKYLIRFHRKYSEDFQLIIVDNDIPTKVEKTINRFTVKRFSVENKEGFQKGFIDDFGSSPR